MFDIKTVTERILSTAAGKEVVEHFNTLLVH